MISPTGIWSAEEAIPQNYPHSENLANKLRDVFSQSKWVIDLGCGPAYYLIKLRYMGYEHLFGVDGHPMLKTSGIIFERLDLSQKNADTYMRGQVLCLEVGEHIPVQYESDFIDNICRHCNSRMVLSWAIEGQGGIGHVNCRNNDYVIDQVTNRGFRLNHLMTDYLRENIEMDVRYFKDTLMVFDKIKK